MHASLFAKVICIWASSWDLSVSVITWVIVKFSYKVASYLETSIIF